MKNRRLNRLNWWKNVQAKGFRRFYGFMAIFWILLTAFSEAVHLLLAYRLPTQNDFLETVGAAVLFAVCMPPVMWLAGENDYRAYLRKFGKN